jgi:hypothetical protein
MNTREQLIKARLGLLALALEQKNIAKACKLAGVSRSHFYAIKRAYEAFGRDGLAPRIRRTPRMPNQTPPELEQQILAMTEQYPTGSYLRLAAQFKRNGVQITAGMVRYVWDRNGLNTRVSRLHWMKHRNAANTVRGAKRHHQRLHDYQRTQSEKIATGIPTASVNSSSE